MFSYGIAMIYDSKLKFTKCSYEIAMISCSILKFTKLSNGIAMISNLKFKLIICSYGLQMISVSMLNYYLICSFTYVIVYFICCIYLLFYVFLGFKIYCDII